MNYWCQVNDIWQEVAAQRLLEALAPGIYDPGVFELNESYINLLPDVLPPADAMVAIDHWERERTKAYNVAAELLRAQVRAKMAAKAEK